MTLFDKITEAVQDKDVEHFAYMIIRDYCLLTHTSGAIIVCSNHEHAQRHPNFGKSGWTLEDGTYLVGARDNDGLALTKKMLDAPFWG